MIEPNRIGAEFQMVWNGDRWQILIDGFNFVGVNDINGLGKEFSQLVIRAFEDAIEPIDPLAPLFYRPNVDKPKFRGNK